MRQKKRTVHKVISLKIQIWILSMRKIGMRLKKVRETYNLTSAVRALLIVTYTYICFSIPSNKGNPLSSTNMECPPTNILYSTAHTPVS